MPAIACRPVQRPALARSRTYSDRPAVAAFLDVAAETLDTIDRVLDDLDDTTVNAAPPVPGVNTVFALVTHVGGALGYWGGSLMAGEDIPRERSTEFRATGTVAEAEREITLA